MARDLDTDLKTLRTVLTYAENRDFQRAGALAEQTLADGFEHPLLLNVLATQMELEGKYAESMRLLERAVAISPGDVGARNALALCLQRLDRPADALHHVDELLKKHPDLGFVHANKGNALIALGSLGSAKQSHLRALELEPGNLAATAALASIATHRGEHEEARRWAAQALATAPGFPDAVLSLAAADLAGGEIDRAETQLQHLILDSRAGPSDRARATGLLGDVLDAAGRYTEAFEAYATCNDALRQIHRRFATGTSMLAYTRTLAAATRAIGPRQWPAVPAPEATSADARGHAFLLGFPRSGTTLLEVVLDGHPDVASIEEHELLTDAALRFMREPLNLDPLACADESQLRPLRAAYWDRVRRTGVDVAGKMFVDKHPLNTLKLPLIARLFPRAKILFAHRDPRDVVLSCYRRRFKMNPAMYELLTLPGAAAFYDAVMDFAAEVRPVLGLGWRDVRYESLVADLMLETREICAFLGLEPVAGMADFAARVQAREHATPSTAQLARGLERSGMEQWRNYQEPLRPILPVLERWVERLGYPA
ncbi:MAG: tetratricopeptide repeat-containing sulfotransferase family protein [Steroidobacteraceae bacterium]